jgi:hypothetical protein
VEALTTTSRRPTTGNPRIPGYLLAIEALRSGKRYQCSECHQLHGRKTAVGPLTAPTREAVLEGLHDCRGRYSTANTEALDRAIVYLAAEEGLLGAAVEVYESIEEPDRHAVAIRRLGQELAERGLE